METKTKGDIKKITDVGKEAEKWNFCALLVGMENGVTIKEQYECLLMDEWINKMWCIHRVEYYLAFKRKELLIYTTTQMSLRTL